MKLDQYMGELANRTGIKKVFWLLLAASVATTLMLTLILLTKKDRVQTVLVPPQIQRTISISNQDISREYLEEMGVFMTQQLLNTSPASIDGQYQVLLKYVDPRYYQALDKELNLTRRYVKRNNVATWFTPRRVTGYTHNNTVEIEGLFMVSQGEKVTQKFNRKLIVSFKNVDGKVALLSIKEEVRKAGKPKPAAASEPVTENTAVQNQVDALDEAVETQVRDYAGE